MRTRFRDCVSICSSRTVCLHNLHLWTASINGWWMPALLKCKSQITDFDPLGDCSPKSCVPSDVSLVRFQWRRAQLARHVSMKSIQERNLNPNSLLGMRKTNCFLTHLPVFLDRFQSPILVRLDSSKQVGDRWASAFLNFLTM